MCLLVGGAIAAADEESRSSRCQHQLLVNLLFIATTPDAAGPNTASEQEGEAKYNLNRSSKK